VVRRAVLALAIGCASCRKPAPAPAPAPDASSTESLPLEAIRARARVPAVAWAHVTKVGQRSGASGLSDVEKRELATAQTPFEAASIAKPLIATCVMQLVEEGRLSLDADVSLIVGFAVRAPGTRAPVTLRQLLSHTASIADDARTGAPRTVPLGEFLAGYFDGGARATAFFDAGPGRNVAYSNVGPALAALAVERASGARFADRVKARIFEPLRMTTATFDPPPRAAVPYRARTTAGGWDASPKYDRLDPPSHALYPVVDLFASADDLGRFARAILRGGELDGARVLGEASVRQMLTVQAEGEAGGEALGWQARRFGDAGTFGHEGEDRGASTGLFVDLDRGTGAVVLTNGDAFQSDDAGRAAALAELVEVLLRP
jgi:CubicO group peptidase (beta-lactamase class C family)